MDEPTKMPGSSFKATLAKFKKFAKDCAEEALRTASNVRRASIGSGSAHPEVKLTENIPSGQTCRSLRNEPEETNELAIIDEEREYEEASVISLMVNKSNQVVEKLQATTISTEDRTMPVEESIADAAKVSEEIIVQTLEDSSEDTSSLVQGTADEVTTTTREQMELVTAKIEHIDLKEVSMERVSFIEHVGNFADRLGDGIKSVADGVKESIVGGSDDENEETNAHLMDIIGKSDVSCTLVGDPSEDFAEACKIVCEFDEDSKANAKRCEYACLAVNNLREEVLNTAKEISNMGEREKKNNSDTLNLISH